MLIPYISLFLFLASLSLSLSLDAHEDENPENSSSIPTTYSGVFGLLSFKSGSKINAQLPFVHNNLPLSMQAEV